MATVAVWEGFGSIEQSDNSSLDPTGNVDRDAR
jgi:hypothetical protein